MRQKEVYSSEQLGTDQGVGREGGGALICGLGWRVGDTDWWAVRVILLLTLQVCSRDF